jgi:hypothetical protein
VTGTHLAAAVEKSKFIDYVDCENLVPGTKYILKGKLMYKDGTEVEIDGAKVTAEYPFEAEQANSRQPVEFTFNAKAIAGKDVVVFEELYVVGEVQPTEEGTEPTPTEVLIAY